MTSLIFLFIALFANYSFSSSSQNCIENRAAFDIGSGTTKLKVATVDICRSKIIKILLTSNREVGYKQDLKESNNNSLSLKIANKGAKALNELVSLAQSFNPKSFVGVATSAFRTSINGKKVAKELTSKTNIKIRIISQREEAILGFVGALSHSTSGSRNLVVWDIGGGSMQLTSFEGNNKYEVYKGALAAVSFKNFIIETIQSKDSKKTSTPNPISPAESKTAIKHAFTEAKSTISEIIKKKIMLPSTEVIAIGGVHYYSIGKKISKNESYSFVELKKLISKSLNLTDKEVGGDYASTDVSNPLLVAGYMEALGLKFIKTARVNLADGILLEPKAQN